MAFDKTNFSPIGGQGARGKAPQMFSYKSGTDALAAVKGSGYFDEVADMLVAGDLIYFFDTAQNTAFDFIRVDAITAGVVTVDTLDVNAA